MKIISSLKEMGINSDSRILVFMPHPDDEAVFISGLLKKLTTNRLPVKVITLTSGEKSTLRYGLKPGADLAAARRTEQIASFKILGVKDYDILTFPDGGLKLTEKEIIPLVTSQINLFNPTHVITLEPDGIYGHPDHISLSKYVTDTVKTPVKLLYATIPEYKIKPKASKMSEKENITPVAPRYCLKLKLTEKMAKIRSLRAHHTQFNVIRADSKDSGFFQVTKLLTNEYFTYRD